MNTKEKLTIKNIKTFPSMEWGENGGLRCDIYLKGKKVAEYIDWGNGGEAEVRMLTDTITHKELQNLCYEATNRLGLNSNEYSEEINYMCAIDTLVVYLQEMKDTEKMYKEKSKKGWNNLLVIKTQFNIYYCAFKDGGAKSAENYLKEKNNLTDDKIVSMNIICDQSYFENL